MRIVHFIALVFFISGVKAQSALDLKRIDKDYINYLNKVFNPEFDGKNKFGKPLPTNIIYSSIKNPSKLFKLETNESIGISAGEKSNKLTAAILCGLEHFSTYEFVADDYEQRSGNKDLVMKEFLRIKVHAIPDTNEMTSTKSTKINDYERMTIYKNGGIKKLNNPIMVSYYSSYQETGNGIEKVVKTIISQNGKIIYSNIASGHRNISKHNKDLNKIAFVYKIGHQKRLISGGLMNLILNNYLEEVKDRVHIESVNLSNVADYYNNQTKDLKRVSGKGILSSNSLDFMNLLRIEIIFQIKCFQIRLPIFV